MIEWLGQSVEHCQLYGKGWLVLSDDIGNILTFAAYFAIPIAILIVMRRREMLTYKYKLAALFAAFIAYCGVGHAIDVLTLHWGASFPWLNQLDAIENLLTGLISIITAWFCFKLVPVICAIPDPIEHELLKRIVACYREPEKWETLPEVIWSKPLK